MVSTALNSTPATKALYPEMNVLFAMMREILMESRLDDEKRLKEILAMLKSRLQMSFLSSGHTTAALRALSYTSPISKFKDDTDGIGFYEAVKKIEEDFEGRKEELIRNLQEISAKIFRAEIVMRPPLNAEQYNTFSFNYKTNTAFSGNTAVMSILDSFWKTSYNTTIPDTAKVKELEAGKWYPCTLNVTTQWGRPAKLNRSSVGRFNFSVNLSSLEAGKEVVIEISDMKFVNLK